MSIHSRNDDVILQFGLKKPAFRIVVNSPTTLGSIGLTTGLDPSMTLGCGGYGGNITSDNISPAAPAEHQAAGLRDDAGRDAASADAAGREVGALPKAPAPPKTRPRRRRGVAGAADRRVPGVARLHRSGVRRTGAARARLRRRRQQPAVGAEPARPNRAGACRREADRLRLRRRRQTGDAAGAEDSGWGADDRDAGGARSRRAAQDVRPGRLAALTIRLLPAEWIGVS